MDIHIFQLSNGIRFIHQYNKSAVAHCGLIINTGTRDELSNEHGLAHFIEHVIFKGTRKRKTFHINSRLEDVGGELNAYTSKEDTAVHATILKGDFEKAVELISDIVFNSIFPPKELEKEKEVILDEINSYKDSPADLIFDDFEDLLFNGTSLGHNILGTKKQLKRFTRENILDFIARTYNTDQMVFSSIGKIRPEKAFKIVEKYLGGIATNPRQYVRKGVLPYQPFAKVISKNTYQTHCIIGRRGYAYSDERRIPLLLLTNILGGPAPNSRLNLALREKYGLTYNVESSFTPYTDTGTFTVYFGTDKANFEKSHLLISKEMKRLQENKLGTLQLHRAKKQVLGQLAISGESNEQVMLTNAKSLLVYNTIDSMEVIAAKINAITSETLIDIANEIFDVNNLSSLTYN
jgi:Predicted Zn-dependent peptidases